MPDCCPHVLIMGTVLKELTDEPSEGESLEWKQTDQAVKSDRRVEIMVVGIIIGAW